MASCDRIEENAFRILRLSVRSNSSDIYSAAAAFRRMATMGIGNLSDADLPKVRAALGIVHKPRQRIEHRLFWFHDPDSQAHWPAAILDDIETQHDIALRALLSAYSRECRETDGMAVVLRQWHRLTSQPGYWEVLNKIEEEGAFEPPALSAELSGLREHAMALAAEPFEEAVEHSWRSRNFSAVRTYFSNLKELDHTGDWTEASRRRLLDWMTGPLVDGCEVLTKQYRTQMIYEDGSEPRNEAICAGELQYYRSFIEPAWDAIAAALPDEETELWMSRGNIADCLAGIAIDHTWTHQEALAQDIANEAIALAKGSIVEAKLRAELSQLLALGGERREEAANQAKGTGAELKIENESARFRGAAKTTHRNKAQPRPDTAVDRLRAHCATLSTFAAKVVAREGFRTENRLICAEELNHFRTHVEPALHEALSELPPTAALSFELREEVAICLGGIAAHHIWADERGTAKTLMLEALRWAEGAWAAISLKKKYLEIQDAVGTQPPAGMSPAASPHKEIDRRIVIGAGLVAILLAFAVVSRAVLPTIGATPQRTSGPPTSAAPRTPTPAPRVDDTEVVLSKLQSQIDTEKAHAATLKQQTSALQKEIASLKLDRAMGEKINSEALNLKLYRYSALLRESRETQEAIDAHTRQRDQLIAQRELSRK
jgi:hypothetical protein